MSTKDITTIDDIKLLVDTFYAKVRQDALIGPIFDQVIQDRWPEHLEKLYRFWQTILLGDHTYYGSPFSPHAHLPIAKEHFSRWIELFHGTVDALFAGDKAVEAKWRAERMSEMFLYKISFIQNNQNNTPPVA